MTARCRRTSPRMPRIKNFTDKIEHDQKAFEKPKGDQPKTLVELGGRAVSASRQGLRNARGALGGSSQEVDQSLPEEPLSLDQSPAPLAGRELPSRKPRSRAIRAEPSEPAARSAVSRARAIAASFPCSAIAAARTASTASTALRASGFAATRGRASAPRRSARSTSRGRPRCDEPRPMGCRAPRRD